MGQETKKMLTMKKQLSDRGVFLNTQISDLLAVVGVLYDDGRHCHRPRFPWSERMGCHTKPPFGGMVAVSFVATTLEVGILAWLWDILWFEVFGDNEIWWNMKIT